MTENVPASAVDDPLLAPFWTATRERRLLIPCCDNCGYTWWPPESICPQCLTPNPGWVEVDDHGTLWSYAVYHRAFSSEFADRIPYVVGLIELNSGPKMYGLLVGPVESWSVGQAMEAVYEQSSEAVFVRWRADDVGQADESATRDL
jgi:uncharacterized OB-fold protein